MKYHNLQELMAGNQNSRHFFLTLPLETQATLRQHGDLIHSMQDVQLHAAIAENSPQETWTNRLQ